MCCAWNDIGCGLWSLEGAFETFEEKSCVRSADTGRGSRSSAVERQGGGGQIIDDQPSRARGRLALRPASPKPNSEKTYRTRYGISTNPREASRGARSGSASPVGPRGLCHATLRGVPSALRHKRLRCPTRARVARLFMCCGVAKASTCSSTSTRVCTAYIPRAIPSTLTSPIAAAAETRYARSLAVRLPAPARESLGLAAALPPPPADHAMR